MTHGTNANGQLRMRSERITLAGHQIVFQLPAEPEALLEQALEGEAAGSAGWDPYWGLLWAAAPLTGELILKDEWVPGLRALELGCGVGLTGIAALKAGLAVTFSDQSVEAVEVACRNAAANGFLNVPRRVFPWHEPPDEQFDLVFASDVLYDRSGHEPLLKTLSSVVSPNGQVWIGDAGRIHAPAFAKRAEEHGWQIELRDRSGRPVREPGHLEFRLIHMIRSPCARCDED